LVALVTGFDEEDARITAVLAERRARIGDIVARDIPGPGIDAVATDDLGEGGDDGR
jgi:CxxC motif-containing protein